MALTLVSWASRRLLSRGRMCLAGLLQVPSGCLRRVSVRVGAEAGGQGEGGCHSPEEGPRCLDARGGSGGLRLGKGFWPFLLPASALCSSSGVDRLCLQRVRQ